jgi:hypothetical protein
MAEKTRKEEVELLSRIEAYRQEFSSSLKNKFLQERDERHRNGEVFFEGYWVPKEMVPEIQQRLKSRGRIIFLEIHLLVLGILFFCMLLWIVFKVFLLP